MEIKNDAIDNILDTSFQTPKILYCESPTKTNHALLYRQEKERVDWGLILRCNSPIERKFWPIDRENLPQWRDIEAIRKKEWSYKFWGS